MRAPVGLDQSRLRFVAMEGTLSPFDYRDSDCSGRSLGTLLVAWVGAAMIASVLLRWKYMWIALAVLTLIFLFVCGYTACSARRTQGAEAAARRGNDESHREREIETVSGRVDHFHAEPDPPMYQTYWVTDLPPSYASVIGVQPGPATTNGDANDTAPTNPGPPPYSYVIDNLAEPSSVSREVADRSTARPLRRSATNPSISIANVTSHPDEIGRNYETAPVGALLSNIDDKIVIDVVRLFGHSALDSIVDFHGSSREKSEDVGNRRPDGPNARENVGETNGEAGELSGSTRRGAPARDDRQRSSSV